ncbi:hypothetical protein A3Q56_05537 [Intoshia linei]|uniref:Ectonucleotide pyrophosphatase/phosphodiesterase family member 5 n=1 Tax=Intoshia linei TaxID=1819745 RepID=A0A177AXJ4_9BILA|nr:hypothetical protein A3Q56_05537 [Intoshia linei]
MIKLIYIIFLFGSIFALEEQKRLILIGLDGFSYDYWSKIEKKHNLPNLRHFINKGVFGRVNNIYQTKTFPSMISIVTGLYSENHGIYGQNFYDYAKKTEYYFNKTDSTFNGAYLKNIQPIWSLVENGPINRTIPFHSDDKSAVFEWISGSKLGHNDVNHHGYPASYYQVYNKTSSFSEKLGKLISMMEKNKNITLGVLYHNQPDYDGHIYGPYTDQVYNQIVSIDNGLYQLNEKLNSNLNDVNLIITSDHGMTMVKQNCSVDLHKVLKDYVDKVKFYGNDVLVGIESNDDKELVVIFDLLQKETNLTVYYKNHFPSKYHYKNSHRVSRMFVLANYGCLLNTKDPPNNEKGNHGYKPENKDMNPIFIGYGKYFRRSFKPDKPIRQIDIYELMCDILGIIPDKNDGDLKYIIHVSQQNESLLFLVFILSLIGVFLVILIGTYILLSRRRHYSNVNM